MKWDWDPLGWKKSTKVLLGLVTLWPLVYMVLFLLTIFSFVFILGSEDGRTNRNANEVDLIQLDRKIRNGEIKELTISGSSVRALDRASNIEYHTYVSGETTRAELIKEARELDANGRPRVDKIEENENQPPAGLFPFGFAALFAAHILTILLIFGLMPLYIVLVVKSPQLDETMRIVWVVLICMMGFFAMPIYWFLYVWRNRAPSSAVETAS